MESKRVQRQVEEMKNHASKRGAGRHNCAKTRESQGERTKLPYPYVEWEEETEYINTVKGIKRGAEPAIATVPVTFVAGGSGREYNNEQKQPLRACICPWQVSQEEKDTK